MALVHKLVGSRLFGAASVRYCSLFKRPLLEPCDPYCDKNRHNGGIRPRNASSDRRPGRSFRSSPRICRRSPHKLRRSASRIPTRGAWNSCICCRSPHSPATTGCGRPRHVCRRVRDNERWFQCRYGGTRYSRRYISAFRLRFDVALKNPPFSSMLNRLSPNFFSNCCVTFGLTDFGAARVELCL